MVNQPISPTTVLTQLERNLNHILHNPLTSPDLAQWAETQQLILLEGDLRDDFSTTVQFLRDVLADITVQWECLISQDHEQYHSCEILQFPSQWLIEWLLQVESRLSSSVNTNSGKLSSLP